MTKRLFRLGRQFRFVSHILKNQNKISMNFLLASRYVDRKYRQTGEPWSPISLIT